MSSRTTQPWVPFFAPTDEVATWLETNARRLATFEPGLSPSNTGRCFYPGDAFYLPYCDFDKVERGGPIITVWALP
jgi:hypothetical protein